MRRETDPLLIHRFALELGFLHVAGFQECTGLTKETRIMEYKEGGRNASALKFPDGGSVGNIVLKRGLLTDSNADVLYKWHHDVMSGEFNEDDNPNLRPFDSDEDINNRCSIILMDETGEEKKRWVLIRAFPLKWSGPDLKSGASEIALESLELACEGIELVE
jgi:phage tail-like protein